MKSILLTFSAFALALAFISSPKEQPQEFQGQAVYFSKTRMDLGRWGSRMSEAQKKQMEARLKNRLEKTYTLDFTREESVFTEEEILDAMSGATDSWGKNFTPGKVYKNIKDDALVQSQEFYGKKFLIQDSILDIDWKMGAETKQIGQYMCFKATASIPSQDLTWYAFDWSELRAREQQQDSTETEPEIPLTLVEAWYTPQIPVSHGPLEYGGLPGLILEVSAGNTTMLCSKIVINPRERVEISAPDKGKVASKTEYKTIITEKMIEMRDNRGRRRSR